MPKSNGNYFFTSESVTSGHPDKICDQVSDAILDELIKQDPETHTGVECFATTNFLLVGGETKSKGTVNVEETARKVIREIGYNDEGIGFDWKTCEVLNKIHEQSPDIAQGVEEGKGEHKEQGAGDQGMMFGYACNETPELMPLPISLAHKLTRRLEQARKSGEIAWIRPDGKSQVTVEYRNGEPYRVDTIVVSTHHANGIEKSEIEQTVKEKIIKPVIPPHLDKGDIRYFINPTGRFVIGGPHGDSGLTGRKIIVDTYGGAAAHGGGCFSGKCPTKVDRSAAYMARYIAKNIVAAGLAEECEIQISYAIGVAEPVSVLANTFGTGKIPDERLAEIVRKIFPLKPAQIIKCLDLCRPIYRKTASGGHFGREDPDFTWETTNKVEELKREAGI